MAKREKIFILGSGGMGTACAVLLADRASHDVWLWSRSPERAAEMDRDRENRTLLPGVAIPASVHVTADIETASGADWVVIAIPTKFLRPTLLPLASKFKNRVPVVSVAKGLEANTLLRPTEIIVEVLGARDSVALAGPSHAEEIARRLPASVVAASESLSAAERVQTIFNTDRFRVYTNADLVGVELAGAIKNVIAIAAGISDGLGFGDNAKSALVTRGLVEMSRFGIACGAQADTFSGLAGIGDLMTTCFSKHSRNRHVGECLGRGQSLHRIVSEMNGVAEGISTTAGLQELAQSRGIEMPITAEVHAVLFEGKSAAEATSSLMLRPPRPER